MKRSIVLAAAFALSITAFSSTTITSGGAGGGATIASTTDLIKGDGAGNGSDALISISGPTGARAKTFRDAADTVLELGGSYTPTGTWTNLTLVTPTLGTPASGNGSNLTALNATQLTTGTVGSARLPVYNWLNNTLAGVDAPIGVPFLVSITGYNLNSAANTDTNLFTVPSGKTAQLLTYCVTVTAKSGTGSTAAIVTIRDSTAGSIVAANTCSLAANPTVNTATTSNPAGGGTIAPTGDLVIMRQTQAGSGATTLTGRMDALFVYLP